MRTVIILGVLMCLVLIQAKPHHHGSTDPSGGFGGGFGAGFGFGGIVAGGFGTSSDKVGTATAATASAGLMKSANFVKKGADCNWRNRQTTTTTTTTTTEASA
ncbi:uncharacterized protein LOC123008961 [Tribolium madens]|uniref:uncharacterized protein LOC123008961 n=1 Tax=Tribolium madens TaxID=41895 RepID=UPI001CF744AB|nr:uncharacterized protein LOC123008961 [Tribolium madens]